MEKSLSEPPKNRTRFLFLIAGVAIVLGAVFVSMFREMGVSNLLKLRDTEKQLRAEVEQLRRENDELKKRVEGLKSNPAVIENEARRMGFIHEKERVFIVP